MDAIGTNSGPTPAAAAAAAAAPDPETAAILERHSVGEKLTQREYGKMGAFARWLKNPLGKGGDAAQPAGSAPPPGKPLTMAAMAEVEASPDSLEPVEIDDTVCQRTAAAILGRADAAAVNWIEREATATVDSLRLSEAQRDKMLARFRRAAGLPVADQKLIVDLSPDVCRELGIDPRQFAVWTVGGVLILHGFNLWQCVQELKDLRRAQERPTAPEPEVKDQAPKPKVSAEPVGPPKQ